MGRWTPLILMAGGLAILLGTLLGISFPMGGSQNANLIGGSRNSRVLPANVTAGDNAGGNRKTASANANSGPVAQGGNAGDSAGQGSSETTAQGSGSTNNTSDANEPIRALW